MKYILLLVLLAVALLLFIFWVAIVRGSGGMKRYIKRSPAPVDPHRGYPAEASKEEIARRVAMVQKSIAASGGNDSVGESGSSLPLPAAATGASDKRPSVVLESTMVGGMTVSIEVTPGDSLLASLGRQATAAKDSGDLDLAVDCLLRQRARAAEIDESISIQTLLRLPLFLQRRGDFGAAMDEFEQLLEKAESESGYLGASPAAKAHAAALWRAAVYDKMRVACSRQKEVARAAECGEACAREREIADALRGVIDEERKIERDNYALRRNSRQRFDEGEAV